MVSRFPALSLSSACALAACTLFASTALLLLPYPGVQNDEALFVTPIYYPDSVPGVKVLGQRIPLMLMSYLGTAKTWLYAPFVVRWRPSPWSLRLPVVAVGTATIWMFYLLLRRLAGERAAAAGALLLGADTMYLLTTLFDWGPVALQHLAVVAFMLAFVRFHQTGCVRSFAAGFFFLGFGLWDKALFLWMLGGLAVAALVVIPRPAWKSVSFRNAAIAGIAFCIGAGPLIVFNLRNPLATLRANTNLSITGAELAGKFSALRATLNGSAVFGYLVAEDEATPSPRAPSGMLERASVAVDRAAGGPREHWLDFATLGAVLLIPFIWRTRARLPALFALVAMAVAWGQMAMTKNAGGSAHHAVLLWPLPHLLIAAVLGHASDLFGRAGRFAATAAVVVLATGGLLVSNHYRAQMIRNGSAGSWTDAVFPLTSYLREARPAQVWMADWGIFDNVLYLSRGRLNVGVGSEPAMKPEPDEDDVRLMRRLAGVPGSLWVGHTGRYQEFPGINARLVSVIGRAGYGKELLTVIADRNQRPVFEVYRLVPNQAKKE